MSPRPMANLEIRILNQQYEGYPVELTVESTSGRQEFPRAYLDSAFPPWEPTSSMREDGERLVDWFFADEQLRINWAEIRGKYSERRILLRIDTDAPELHTISWELLRDMASDSTISDLAASSQTPFSRYLAHKHEPGVPAIESTIKVLVAIASPNNLAEHGLSAIDVEAELALMQEAIADLNVELTLLSQPCTLSALEATLRQGHHVLHFIGHGAYSDEEDRALLCMADNENKLAYIYDDEFATMLRRQRSQTHPLRLIFLDSCQTATRSTTDAFRGFAPQLVNVGIPAVLAMQDLIAVKTARTFTHTFYQHLLQHGQIDLACNQARSTILTAKLPGGSIPVLFSRLPNGLLIDVAQAAYTRMRAGDDIDRCDFYQHIHLPPNFVPRSELFAEVRSSLLLDRDSHTVAFTSAIKMDAFHGMGGIGKTVIARALCDDLEIQAAFPDGILWATLGQTPELVTRLKEWVNALGGTISENIATVNLLKNTLAKLLEKRACLLIVDDVWHAKDAEAFQVGGPKCRLLLTTRDAAIADKLNATIQPIPVMTQAEAIDLLKEWSGPRPKQIAPEILEQIVDRLGRLPLAIKLAGGPLRSQAPERWLRNFDLRKLKSRRVEDTHDSLEATFALSLDELDTTDRELYTSLAIFKEDEPIPAVPVAKLWKALAGLDQDGTHELLDDLRTLALVQLDANQRQIEVNGDQPEFDLTVTLHDLLRDFMEAELGKAGILRSHQALLNAYRQTRSDEGWASALDDGYLYGHLAYHLDQIADEDQVATDELKLLFDNHNWLHARVSSSNYEYDGYIADLTLAWHRTQAQLTVQIEDGDLSIYLADCVRYALIRTSINSLATNYEPALVARAVETGIWSANRALKTAMRVPDPKRRCEFITLILNTNQFQEPSNRILRKMGKETGLAAAMNIQDEGYRADALSALTSQLSGEAKERALQARLVIALNIQDEQSRANSLIALAPQLSKDLLETGLTAVRNIQNDHYRVDALAAFAPRLSGDLLEIELIAALEMQYEWMRAKVLSTLAPQLSGDLLEAGLTAALDIQNENYRGDVLLALAPRLNGELLEVGRIAVRNIQDGYTQARILALLQSGEAKERTLQACLTVALNIQDESIRAKALTDLAPQLRGEARQRALREGLTATLSMDTRGYNVIWEQIRILSALAPQLNECQLQKALKAALDISFDVARVKALIALVPQLKDEAKERAIRETLKAALDVANDSFRAETLSALAPQLSGELIKVGLKAALNIQDKEARAISLSALAPQLSGELVKIGLTAIRNIQDWKSQSKALSALAPQIDRELLQVELSTALNIHDESSQSAALSALAPQLSSKAKKRALQMGLAAVLNIQEEKYRVEALGALASQLSGEILEAGLTATLDIQGEKYRAEVLSAFAPKLTGGMLQTGLTAALDIQEEEYRAEVLSALAPKLTGGILQTGLTAVLDIQEEEYRAEVLVALAPKLTGDLLHAGWTAALDMRFGYKIKALSALAPQLSGDLLQVGLAAALNIQDERSQARILLALAPQLSGDLLQVGLAAALDMEPEWYRAEVLSALAPKLSGELKKCVLKAGLVAVRGINNKEPCRGVLSALAPHLSVDLLQEELTVSRKINKEWYQIIVLITLVPKLNGEAKEFALKEGLSVALALSDEETRAESLMALASYLSGETKERVQLECLSAVLDIPDEERKAEILVDLVSNLSGETKERALLEGLTIVQNIQHSWLRVVPQWVLYNLVVEACNLNCEAKERVLKAWLPAFQIIQDESVRASLLTAISPNLSENLLEEGLTIVQNISDAAYRVRTLATFSIFTSKKVPPVNRVQKIIATILLDHLQNQKTR